MSIDHEFEPAKRDRGLAIRRGLACRCPQCGEGHLFYRFLKVVPACEACHEDLSPQRADDLPAYIVLFITGHIVIGLMMTVETNFDWPIWLHSVVWPLLTLIVSLGLIQPVKGAVIGLQWALRMHGFSSRADGDDTPLFRATGDGS